MEEVRKELHELMSEFRYILDKENIGVFICKASKIVDNLEVKVKSGDCFLCYSFFANDEFINSHCVFI